MSTTGTKSFAHLTYTEFVVNRTNNELVHLNLVKATPFLLVSLSFSHFLFLFKLLDNSIYISSLLMYVYLLPGHLDL